MGTLLPPARAPLLKASTGPAGPLSPSRTLTHVRSAPSAKVEQEKPDTARRAHGDSATFDQINRIIIPLNEGRIAAIVRQNGLRAPCPPWSTAETVGRSTSTFWPFFAYERWCHQARIRRTGLVYCTRSPEFSELYAAGPRNYQRRLGTVDL